MSANRRREPRGRGVGPAPAPHHPEGGAVKLEWQRPGVVCVTAKVEELALLVAAGRIAAAALENQPGEQAAALEQVLRNLDRAIAGLRSQGTAPDIGDRTQTGTRRLARPGATTSSPTHTTGPAMPGSKEATKR